MAGLINTAISGLQLSQLSLSIAGQNIVNANTEGYSRQSVTAETTTPQFVGVGYVGTGVAVSQIVRNSQQFLVDQVTNDLSVLGEFDQFLANVSQVDNLLADPSTSVAASMESFFEALNGVANNPSGLESRQLLLTQTQLMLDRFKATETNLLNQNDALNSQLDSYARRITTIGHEIAELNTAISSSEGLANGVMPNDLLDRRDTLVHELAEIVDVKISLQENQSISVFIGEGQGLVIGPEPAEVVATAGLQDPSRAELAFVVNNKLQPVTAQITGGEIGGVLRFRNEALDPALNALGRIGLTLTDSINHQQLLGVDLEGNLGNPIFTDINDAVLANNRVRVDSRNSPPADREISVTIDDLSQLSTSDYKLVFPGPGQRYSLVRLEDNTLVSQGILGGKLPDQVSVDGFTLNFEGGSFQEGDNFLIQPTRAGIGSIDVLVNRPEAFALASPIRTETAIGNQGGAFISAAQVTDVTTSTFTQSPGQLSPPIVIRFTSPSTYDVLDYSDPANPISLRPPLNNRNFVPGALNAVFPEEVGGTAVSSLFANVGKAQLSSLSNGYQDEVLTITHVDPVTGFATETNIETSLNQGANTLAQQLSAVEGISATAYSHLQLSDFQSDGENIPLNVILNDVDLSSELLTQGRAIPDPPDADFLRDSINLSLELQAQGIYAVSDGETLTVKSSTGVDLRVEVTGNGGDSLQLRDGDLRSIVGKNDVSVGFEAPVNSSFDIDLGFGVTTIMLTPGSVSHNNVISAIQADIDASLGAAKVRVSRSDSGFIVFESVDPTATVNISNVSSDDVLGIGPIIISGPDIGDQAAEVVGGASALDPYDFTAVNGSFDLTVNGIYSDTLNLTQNFPVNSEAAIVNAINAQIAASAGPGGLAGEVYAELDAAGVLRFVSTDTGPSASITVTAAVATQNLVINGSGIGTQLSGTNATVLGAVDVNNGVDFNSGGPHNFMIAVDGNPPVQVNLTGRSGIPATFTNTVDISAGVDFSAAPNSFEVTLAGQPTVVIDISGVDTTLAPDPYSSAPQGIVNLFQQQLDAQLGVGEVTVGMNPANQLTLTTADAGLGTSITISNPVGDVATDVFPVTGTFVGSEQGGAGVVNLVSTAINNSLAAAGHDPVNVSISETGVLEISSSTYGTNSQISIADVNGSFGMIFPGIDQGKLYSASATVGGNIDVQLSENVSLSSNQEDGYFGTNPDAVENYTGFQIFLNSGLGGSGLPVAGDSFFIDFNGDGTADNSNAHSMIELSNKQLLSNGNLGLQSAFGQMVEEIGILTSQTRISQEASESLLRQSEAALQSTSGVNIDEEAANLIKFEQHYNASAQLISIARDLFDRVLQL